METPEKDRFPRCIMRMRFLLLSLLLLLPAKVGADPFILTTSEYKPFSSQEGGLAMDIIRAALDAVGAEPEFVFRPWKRGELGVLKGDFVGTFPYSANAQRLAQFAFTDSLLRSNAVFFMRKEQMPGWDYDGVASLKPYTVACVPGYFYNDIFDKHGVRCQPVDRTRNAFRMLLKGRVDFVVESEAVGWMELDQLGPDARDQVRAAPTPIRTGVSAIMTAKSSPRAAEFRKRFNRGLKAIQADGTYDAILKKYNLLQNER